MATVDETRRRRRLRAWLYENGLLLTCLALFLIFFIGMIMSGVRQYNSEQMEHGATEAISVWAYLRTGDFVEAVFENWESEFLQMAMYVVLTVFLFQKGSSESKPPHETSPQDQDPRSVHADPRSPWPVRRGGIWLTIYQNSLAGAFFVLFFASLALHAVGGAAAYNSDQLDHGRPTVSVWDYLGTSQFWFESMQNWQSEFIAVAAIIGGSIYLRQKGSPESKPVAESSRETGA
ncbi:hypothetical protein GTV32_18490 [Gordonia sp. SID5947]|uniref:DUF6766 family protein n=1 Tax=Gordonia sp. SID5947 TaxID=2690315 RepID=UPI0013699686|nr:hypothetical protein [Gordonia sp. SID5947]